MRLALWLEVCGREVREGYLGNLRVSAGVSVATQGAEQ